MTTNSLNALFRKNEYQFQRLEFERGLGIVDDAFYLTLKSRDCIAVVKIVTNLRCVKRGKTLLRYNDLFLDKAGKEISKKEFRSQTGIEKTLLQTNLEYVNNAFSGKSINKISLSSYGDLKVTLSGGSIIACDDVDVRKDGRHLIDVLLLENSDPCVIVVSDYRKSIRIAKTKDVIIYPEKDGCGLRFLLAKK